MQDFKTLDGSSTVPSFFVKKPSLYVCQCQVQGSNDVEVCHKRLLVSVSFIVLCGDTIDHPISIITRELLNNLIIESL
jgi:hypothetical protein